MAILNIHFAPDNSSLEENPPLIEDNISNIVATNSDTIDELNDQFIDQQVDQNDQNNLDHLTIFEKKSQLENIKSEKLDKELAQLKQDKTNAKIQRNTEIANARKEWKIAVAQRKKAQLYWANSFNLLKKQKQENLALHDLAVMEAHNKFTKFKIKAD